LALAAELNGYPGPLHVLELGDRIALSADQKLRVQRLYEAMKAEAIAAGAKLIEREKALDTAFAAREITREKTILPDNGDWSCARGAARGAPEISFGS
jgi:hypothetical protein